MSEPKPKYQGKPKGGAGLGQGQKKTKEFSKKTFALELKVIDILGDYSTENGMPKGTMVEFVELAILDLHRQIQEQFEKPEIDTDTYFNFQERKDKFFTSVATQKELTNKQFL